MARVYTRFPFSRRDEFASAEGIARKEGKGVWKDGGMAEAR
jgi:endonuclease YncB( thermonuclease family)